MSLRSKECRTCQRFGCHNKEISGILYFPSVNFVVSCSLDSSLRIWSASGVCRRVFHLDNNFEFENMTKWDTRCVLACASDGTGFYYSSRNCGLVVLYDLGKLEVLSRVAFRNGILSATRVSESLVVVLSGKKDFYRVVDIYKGNTIHKITFESHRIVCLEPSKLFDYCFYYSSFTISTDIIREKSEYVKLINAKTNKTMNAFLAHGRIDHATTLKSFVNRNGREMLFYSAGSIVYLYDCGDDVDKTMIETRLTSTGIGRMNYYCCDMFLSNSFAFLGSTKGYIGVFDLFNVGVQRDMKLVKNLKIDKGKIVALQVLQMNASSTAVVCAVGNEIITVEIEGVGLKKTMSSEIDLKERIQYLLGEELIGFEGSSLYLRFPVETFEVVKVLMIL